MKYAIFDRAGNDQSKYYGVFDTCEDAWDALYEEFLDDPEDFVEEILGEFCVERIA